jgi:hypothetical protein
MRSSSRGRCALALAALMSATGLVSCGTVEPDAPPVEPVPIIFIRAPTLSGHSITFGVDVACTDHCQTVAHYTVTDSAGAFVIQAYQHRTGTENCEVHTHIFEVPVTIPLPRLGRYLFRFRSRSRPIDVEIDVR